jgi:hypothetical protein
MDLQQKNGQLDNGHAATFFISISIPILSFPKEI